MSASAKERSDSGDVVGGDGGDDDGSDRRDDHRKKTKKQRGHGSGGTLRKAKRAALFRFRKVDIKSNRRPANPSSSGCLGKWVGGGGGGYCCFKQTHGGDGGGFCCFKPTPVLDSPVETCTSDPNSPEFTFELLRDLIEKNDFYSEECNPHLCIDKTDEN
ncbi:hypothetical protein U1Q18_035597 [Sarracenia purpurea var. burkii]